MKRAQRVPAALPAAAVTILAAAMTAAAAVATLTAVPTPTAAAAERHRLILDWFPNADHVPLYVARDDGPFEQRGLEIELVPPADPNDPLKLVAAGKASFAINYQPNVIIARSRGLPVVSIGVLVEHPLSSLAYLEQSGIETPADLAGKRIGYSVQDLELALLRALAASAGVRPADYETVNVNFNLTSSLLTGQVDAVIGAFWNYEMAELELEGVPADYFYLPDHGIPDYYELVVITNEKFLAGNRDTARRLVAALQEAIAFSREHPEAALETYFAANPEVRKELDRRAFERTRDQFAHTQQQSRAKWAEFTAFAKQQGVIDEEPPVDELFENLAP